MPRDPGQNVPGARPTRLDLARRAPAKLSHNGAVAGVGRSREEADPAAARGAPRHFGAKNSGKSYPCTKIFGHLDAYFGAAGGMLEDLWYKFVSRAHGF